MNDAPHPALLPTGMHDLLPPEAEIEAQVVARLMATLAAHGYERVKPPLVEFEETLFSGAGAAMATATFRMMDPASHRMIGVRADMTPQIARIAATRLRDAPRPLRLSYAGQVLRVSGSEIRPERQVGQVGAEPSEPAGNGYARKITALTALGYAPLAASLSDDGSVAGATYVLATGAAFFISYGAAQSGQITRAQGDLSANLGVAAGAAGLGVGYAATGNGDRGVRAIALGSALAGTIAGIGLGRHLTDAEAHSATLGIEGTAASAWAIGAAAGAQGRSAQQDENLRPPGRAVCDRAC